MLDVPSCCSEWNEKENIEKVIRNFKLETWRNKNKQLVETEVWPMTERKSILLNIDECWKVQPKGRNIEKPFQNMILSFLQTMFLCVAESERQFKIGEPEVKLDEKPIASSITDQEEIDERGEEEDKSSVTCQTDLEIFLFDQLVLSVEVKKKGVKFRDSIYQLAGEMLAQAYEKKRSYFYDQTTKKVTLYGGLFLGPILYGCASELSLDYLESINKGLVPNEKYIILFSYIGNMFSDREQEDIGRFFYRIKRDSINKIDEFWPYIKLSYRDYLENELYQKMKSEQDETKRRKTQLRD